MGEADSRTTKGMVDGADDRSTAGVISMLVHAFGDTFYTVISTGVKMITATLSVFGIISSTPEAKEIIQSTISAREEDQ